MSALILFDPKAKGSLPVEKYRKSAARFGFILIGSNNVKNGMQTEQSTDIARTLIGEVQIRFHLPPSRIFLGGFSGGARMAGAAVAVLHQVPGLIVCSAGLPQQGRELSQSCLVAAIGGEADANYPEVFFQHDILERNHHPNLLLTFNGTHEWPPEETFSQAMIWLLVQYHLASETAINDVHRDFLKKIASAKAKDNLVEEYELTMLERNLFAGMSMADTIRLAALAHHNKVIDHERHFRQYLEGGEKLKEQYANAMLTNDDTWWRKEITKLKNEKTTDPTEYNMNKRILGYLGLAVYSYCGQALSSRRDDVAEKTLSLYRMIEPQNADMLYFSAIFEMHKQNNKGAIEYLKMAVKNGLDNPTRICNDPVLSILASNPEVAALCQ